MIEIAELDPLGFPRILHAMLRANDTPDEVTRATEVMKWVCDNMATVRVILMTSEARLVGVIHRHFLEHKSPTNRIYAEEIALNEYKPDGMVALLESYDESIPNLQPTSALDMSQLMADRVTDWERVKMLDTLATARMITTGSLQPRKETDPRLKGARDAAGFLSKHMYADVMVTDSRILGGSVKDRLPTIMGAYEQNKAARQRERLQIRTQLSCLDNSIRGFRKPELIGVLGYAGQFKTTLCRTFLYNAAQQGYRCLHIPLESSYDEELTLYGILHAHNPIFKGMIPDVRGISRQNFEEGNLSCHEAAFLRDTIIRHFQEYVAGDVVIRQPAGSTWPEVKQIIELEDRIQPIDLVLIDYLALMDVGDSRYAVGAINETIKQVKNLCLTFRGGKGLAIITPVQGKREGYEHAKENGGMWTADGAYMYSEFEKSVDKMIYVYTDNELNSDNCLKVGSCKSRRTIDAPASIVRRHPQSGRITDQSGSGADYEQEPAKFAGGVREEGWEMAWS